MSVEPHALMRADHACREQLPANADLYLPLYDGTLSKINRAILKTSGRVQLYYTKNNRRRQLTVDGDTMLVVSVEDISERVATIILREAGLASAPFRSYGLPVAQGVATIRLSESQTSVLTAMHGCNFHG